jgi:hypothetical protein
MKAASMKAAILRETEAQLVCDSRVLACAASQGDASVGCHAATGVSVFPG